MSDYSDKIDNHYVSASLLVQPIDWQLPKLLDNVKENNKLYLKYKTAKTKLHSFENGAIDLVESGQHVILLNHSLQRIEYYVQYEYGRFRGIKTITQIALWAYADYPLPSIDGLSAIKWTFLKYLLPKTNVIAADTLQTELGKRFWLRRIGDAWDSSLNVYMVLRDKDTIVRVDNRDDLHLIEPYVWGTKSHHEYRRAFISKEPIFPNAISVAQFLKL